MRLNCHLSVIAGGAETAVDTLWERVRTEASDALARAPMLAPLLAESVLNQPCLEAAAFHRIASRLRNETVSLPLLVETFARAAAADHTICEGVRTDLAAVVERDPACARAIEPLLYFKGFHALQTHRLAHYLWGNDERDFALYLQSRSSELFQTDIHPAATFGMGIFLDHATGLVVGETAVVGDDVSMLQDVTLGGTGKETCDRHPKIGRGVLIGAGAKILGNIQVGEYARIAAGSLVLQPVQAFATVAGIPARMIKSGGNSDQNKLMDQALSDLSYESFAYSI